MKSNYRFRFKQLQWMAQSLGIVLQRKGKKYEYWNKREGGGTVGEAATLREAYDDFDAFKN